jgi:pyridoxamine 5'-phosphate oxidase
MTEPHTKLSELRTDYKRATLDEHAADPDPFRQFVAWFNAAVAAQVPEPNAMTLATVGADGQPAARIVLLKDTGSDGFTFYTNYDSRKGRELAAHPQAALLFFWPELERQIRIEGRVVRVDAATADAYFDSRPRLSRLGAWASPQSAPLADRGALEARFTAAEARFPGEYIDRPPHWGGFRLVPHAFEFWQGRRSRLHDRIVYRLGDSHWQIGRLAP